MTRLNRAAREQIGWERSRGATIVGYIRHHMTWRAEDQSKWSGDECGCPDDRCIGYHHEAHEECGCFAYHLDEYLKTLA